VTKLKNQISWPVSQTLFGLASIGAMDWLLIVTCSLPVLLIVELEKYVLGLFFSRNNENTDSTVSTADQLCEDLGDTRTR
jgi:hypothetical protein